MARKIDNAQISIYDLFKELDAQEASAGRAPIPGSFNIEATVRELISESMRGSLNRYGIASEMSRLLGREITKAQLDSWSAESKETHRFPLAYLPAFITATGCRDLLKFICKALNGHFIESEEALRLEISKIDEQKKELDARKKTITEFLKNKK